MFLPLTVCWDFVIVALWLAVCYGSELTLGPGIVCQVSEGSGA